MNRRPLLAVLACCALLAGTQIAAAQNRPIKKVNDTDFIVREITPGNYHAVYIEHNRQSEWYKQVLNFKLDSSEKIDYQQAYKSLKRRIKAPLKVYNLTGLPKYWLPLYRYKGKYYLYNPCDGGSLDRRRITDSTTLNWDWDPYLEALQNVKKINGHTWYLETYPHGMDSTTAKLTIHIIDPKNKIAVWEDASASPQYRYGLYVALQNATNFDMVVNYCRDVRSDEFRFDDIDYAALLKGKALN